MHSTDLPLPNIYFASIHNGLTGETHSIYVAADFTGAAFAKVGNLCADRFNFRPYRSNATIKLRRLKLGDMVENPYALTAAVEVAHALGERETVARLQHRPRQVQQALFSLNTDQRTLSHHVDAEAVCKALGEALREAEIAFCAA